MNNRKVTIEHIASISGYSPSTVSRALRDDPAANRKTAQKILEIARKLNYVPNLLAKGLRQNKTRTIGIIFNDLNNPFYTEILSEMAELLNEKNYSMFICYSHYDSERERKNIFSLLSKKVDGIIMSPISNRSENIKILKDNNAEAVFIDSLPFYKDWSYVYTDHRKGVKTAAECLIKNGHKKILLFIGPREKLMANHFITGYKKTLRKYAIPIKEELILEAEELSIECGYVTFRKLLTGDIAGKNLDFTGIITQTDLLAIGIYKAANELGFRIPDNYSIIGYDNIEVTSALRPPLTTVHQSRKRIGRECVNILLQNIENETKEVRVVGIEPYIVLRGSVRKVN